MGEDYPIKKTKGRNDQRRVVTGWLADPLPMGDHRSERRKSGHRLNAFFQVADADGNVIDECRIPVEIIDLSSGGSQIRVRAILQPGLLVNLFIQSSRYSGDGIIVNAKVIRCINEGSSLGPKRFSAGLKFVNPSSETQVLIKKFISD